MKPTTVLFICISFFHDFLTVKYKLPSVSGNQILYGLIFIFTSPLLGNFLKIFTLNFISCRTGRLIRLVVIKLHLQNQDHLLEQP
jgi:hypothetical protein